MKFKKLVSAVSALTVAAGCIAGMTITASAAETKQQATLVSMANKAGGPLENAMYVNYYRDLCGVGYLHFSFDSGAIQSATLTVDATSGSTTSRVVSIDAVGISAGECLTVNETAGGTYTQAGTLIDTSETYEIKDLTTPKELSFDVTSYLRSLNSTDVYIALIAHENIAADSTLSNPELTITYTDEILYNAEIKTSPYAKITYDEKTYYTGADGIHKIEGLTEGTQINYTVNKGGYDQYDDTINVQGEDIQIQATLNPSDEGVLYVEDFENTGFSDKQVGLYNYDDTKNIYSRLYEGGIEFVSSAGGNRSASIPLTYNATKDVVNVSFDLDHYIYSSDNNTGDTTITVSGVTITIGKIANSTEIASAVMGDVDILDMVNENGHIVGKVDITYTKNDEGAYDVEAKLGAHTYNTTTTALPSSIEESMQRRSRTSYDNIVVSEKDVATPAFSINLGEAYVSNGTEDFADQVATGYIATISNTGAEGTTTKVNVTVDTATQSAPVAVTLAKGASAYIGMVLNNVDGSTQTVTATVE